MMKRGLILSHLLTLLFLVLAIELPLMSGAEPIEKWVTRYNGPGNSADQTNAIAVDSEGNVYVTGLSIGSGTDYDYTTVKYHTDGNQLWVKRYNGPLNSADGANDIAIDSLGNVYVTGYSYGSGTDYDYATVKYHTDGNQLWVERYNGLANSADQANAITVDSEGNVYVTGVSLVSGTNYDYATVKYHTDGNQLWVKRYNYPINYYDGANDIAIDSLGNVYVTGYSYGSGTDYDYATVKYHTDGNQLWVKRYNGTANYSDSASAIAVDSLGNVYVTGYSVGSGTSYDYATVKYDTDGNQLWVKQYNGPANNADEAVDIAVDLEGNVYVTGYSYGSIGTDYDYATVKYHTDGNQLWVKRYNGTANYSDSASAIAVDSLGNVYVTGYSVGSGTSYDYATVKYDTDGNQLWVKQYNGPANNADEAVDIAVDLARNVYVSGYSVGSGTNYDYATVKYTPVPIQGDFDGDGDVDGSDLAVFAADFGRTDCSLGSICEGDFDNDGDVDGSDLAIFAANFGMTN